jgi:hypothetical protein
MEKKGRKGRRKRKRQIKMKGGIRKGSRKRKKITNIVGERKRIDRRG